MSKESENDFASRPPRPNSDKDLFLFHHARDIPFRLRYQYISRRRKNQSEECRICSKREHYFNHGDLRLKS